MVHNGGLCQKPSPCVDKIGHHQGGGMQVLDASTGDQLRKEGKNWLASHSLAHMTTYNNWTDAFLIADAGDGHPYGWQFTFIHKGRVKKQDIVKGWGNRCGLQGMSTGAIKPQKTNGGFGSVWNQNFKKKKKVGPAKLYFGAFDQ